MQKLDSMQKTNLPGLLANQIRKRIITGEYSESFHLNETVLATEYNVSRGSIREAIRILQAEGLVEISPNGRAYALQFSEGDFKTYQRFRYLIEIEACQKIITESHENEKFYEFVKTLIGLGDVMKNNLNSENFSEYCANDYLLHDLVIQRAEINILNGIWQSLSGIRRSIMESNIENLFKNSAMRLEIGETHQAYIKGIITRDMQSIDAALRIHFDSGSKLHSQYKRY
jgi:DNA-binding GntR family transcriptional regulator